MSHSTYQKPLMLFAFVTMTWRSSGSFLTLSGQGENKFVMCGRLCKELWFKVLELCCRWHVSTVLEAFVCLKRLCSCGDRYIVSFCTDSFLRTCTLSPNLERKEVKYLVMR